MNARILPVPTVTQYEEPFCLYACASMVLSCFGIRRSISEISYEVSLEWPGDSLDGFLGELVAAVTDYLGDMGLEARYHTDGDWDGIREHIDRGHPLIAFVKPYAGDALVNHAWVIRGYDDAGALVSLDEDPRTEAVVMIGEIGGAMEEDAADYANGMDKPIVAFIAGAAAPPGKKMGHAGAIVMGNRGTYAAKKAALEAAGAAVLPTPGEIGTVLRERMGG